MKRHNPYFRTLSVLAVCAALALLVMAARAMTFAAPDSRVVPAVQSAPQSGQPVVPASGHWVVVNSPNVGTGSNSLASVTGNSANDVTAVGSYFDSSSHELTLIEHWNGTAWSVVPSQNPDPNLNRLSSVTSNKSGGYWAAGLSFSPTYGSLIEEQATVGASWTLVPVPSISGYPSLLSISADSPSDAWAVGDYNGGSPNYYQQTLVMHWNGTAWSQVTSPNPGSAHNYLTGVVAVDANNMWAVGYTNTPPSTNFSPITIHCNSSLTCTSVPFPSAGTSAQLRGVTGRLNGSSVQLWASGYYADTTLHALAAYGDGSSWSLQSPTSLVGVLNGIDASQLAGPSKVMGVGDDEATSPIGPSSVLSGTTLVSPNPGNPWVKYQPVYVGVGTALFFSVYYEEQDHGWYSVGYYTDADGYDRTYIEIFVPDPTPTATPTCADPVTPGPSPTSYLAETTDDSYHTYLVAYNPADPPNPAHILDTDLVNLFNTILTTPQGQNNARDAKLMFQECFGGGMLQATKAGLNPGLKWVGGAASRWDQSSGGQLAPAEATALAGQGYYFSPASVSSDPFGYWTLELQANLPLDTTLVKVLKFTKTGDKIGNFEDGQFVSENGGDTIRLVDACSTSHHAILWGGDADKMSIYNNIDAIRTNLILAWGQPNGNTVTIDVLFGDGVHRPDGGPLPAEWNAHAATALELYAAASRVSQLMNPGEQFLFYASGHGGRTKPYSGGGGVGAGDSPATTPTATPVPLPPGGQRQDSFSLTQADLRPIVNEPNAAPALVISYTGSLDSNTAVSVAFNGTTAGYLRQGTNEVTLHVSTTVLTTTNTVLLHSSNSTTIYINEQSFDSGPIETLPPQVCTAGYSDVPSGSTFYPFVECLACAGMISGYPDGTFRPGNQVTRGQLAKIVSNSARYNDVYTTATFNDVPVGSTFYQYVERLSSRSIINGYPCGGPGEPCPGMYFRPNNNVTRGQTSKIVAIANGLPAPPQGQQTFQDVAPSSTFWPWIEALASTGTIGGYPCGGPAEPCVPPANRPYFRSSSNVTRGQASKIVSKSFFPNCQAP